MFEMLALLMFVTELIVRVLPWVGGFLAVLLVIGLIVRNTEGRKDE